MECPLDALGRNECFEHFASVAEASAHEAGVTQAFVVTVGRPAEGTTSAQSFTCPHGNHYWIGEADRWLPQVSSPKTWAPPPAEE